MELRPAKSGKSFRLKSPDGQEITAKRGRLAMRKELAYEIPVRAVERGFAPLDPLIITTLDRRDFRYLDRELGSINHTSGSDLESSCAWRKLRNNFYFAIFRTQAV